MPSRRRRAPIRKRDTAEQAVLDEMAVLHHRLANDLTQIGGRAQLLAMTQGLPPRVLADTIQIRDTALAAGRTLQRLAELTSSLRRDKPTP